MDNLVSVILPVYNGERFLNKSIDSVLNQTYNNFELIIINDGSTDKSDLIINKYLPNVKIKYFSRENKGLVATLNEATQRSSGSFIARMDQDDICYPTRIQKQLDFLVKYNIDVCGSSYEIIDENEKVLKVINTFNEYFEVMISAMLVPFAHPSVMFRNIFKSKGFSYGSGEITFAEDYDLWIKMAKKDISFGNLKEVLFKYRVYGNSLSSVTRVNIFNEVYKSCSKYNKDQSSKLISIYENISLGDINYSFGQILVKSILNFIKSNGFNHKAIKILFRINFKTIFLGFLKFIKQEFLYVTYKVKFFK
ncbi:glycosyltransferase [Flavobacteriaceae bacterium]|jgi:glycosyltransferase involved in cell wall biosynthesis|nr:glycosyltransferase [Flavobacteriaceae bacterium]